MFKNYFSDEGSSTVKGAAAVFGDTYYVLARNLKTAYNEIVVTVQDRIFIETEDLYDYYDEKCIERCINILRAQLNKYYPGTELLV